MIKTLLKNLLYQSSALFFYLKGILVVILKVSPFRLRYTCSVFLTDFYQDYYQFYIDGNISR